MVLPAASAYEKNGTVTNITGEVQRLKRAINTMGAKPDLEIMGFIAREMGVAAGSGSVAAGSRVRGDSQERSRLQRSDAGYRTGRRGADHAGQRAYSVERRPDLVHSDHNGLFASGHAWALF